MMFTLRQADEIRKMSAIDELDQVPDEVNDAEIALAKQVIGNFEGDLELSEFRDEYQAELRKIIDAKDRRGRSGRARGGGASQGRRLDGGATQEPGHRQCVEEEGRKGDKGGAYDDTEAKASVTPTRAPDRTPPSLLRS